MESGPDIEQTRPDQSRANRPTVALEVWSSDFNQVLNTCRAAEDAGIDAFYYGESPHDLNMECWTVLAALARSTSRIRLGPVITNLLPSYRSPLLAARQVLALHEISQGRVEFRTGVGADRPFGRAWWEPLGVDYPAYDQRLVDLTTGLDVLADHGAAGHLSDGVAPLTVAARGRRAMELAGRRADVWETSFATVAEFEQRCRLMDQMSPGRRVTRSLEIDGFVAPTDAEVASLTARVTRERSGEYLEPVWDRALIGTPSQVADQLARLEAAGVDQVVVALHDPHDPKALAAVAEAVETVRRRG